MKVLVTGGSGFIGKRLQKIKPDWIYLSSKDCDLRYYDSVYRKLSEIRPDAIIHLAGKVGGIKDNANKQGEYFYDNIMINTNIVNCAYQLGIKRLLASLSTCAFPDVVTTYPLTENNMHDGPPAKTNFSYGYAKRSLHVMLEAYRNQYGVNYSSFCPSNIYGPQDNFNLESSHFVPAMIRKFEEAKHNDIIEFWGDGKALRQQLYVDDLISIIPFLLDYHNSNIPLIVSPDENLYIKTMIKICQQIFEYKYNKRVEYAFNGKLSGQFRKDGSNFELQELIKKHNFEEKFFFTPFYRGLEKTIKWYKEEIKNV